MNKRERELEIKKLQVNFFLSILTGVISGYIVAIALGLSIIDIIKSFGNMILIFALFIGLLGSSLNYLYPKNKKMATPSFVFKFFFSMLLILFFVQLLSNFIPSDYKLLYNLSIVIILILVVIVINLKK